MNSLRISTPPLPTILEDVEWNGSAQDEGQNLKFSFSNDNRITFEEGPSASDKEVFLPHHNIEENHKEHPQSPHNSRFEKDQEKIFHLTKRSIVLEETIREMHENLEALMKEKTALEEQNRLLKHLLAEKQQPLPPEVIPKQPEELGKTNSSDCLYI
ncbi:MAG: hypothetical protein A3E26_06245 [Chlamydiae bacterium RIFCSPHIGHO2_12_FULL_49_32]|nr:MAG: hypothetical protein A3D18_05655 [Chlamydiae bacterium RIFCSPHIGHO2_02_FULL_49_29]OGN63162.1 MAG: hypothetical protein A3E26_06245 [Chlamydiae bacterium RIFCSPHIGHO2_12_FULL_49_32]